MASRLTLIACQSCQVRKLIAVTTAGSFRACLRHIIACECGTVNVLMCQTQLAKRSSAKRIRQSIMLFLNLSAPERYAACKIAQITAAPGYTAPSLSRLRNAVFRNIVAHIRAPFCVACSHSSTKAPCSSHPFSLRPRPRMSSASYA